MSKRDKFRPLDEYLDASWLQPERVPFLRDVLVERIKELEARLKQTQDWRDYYRARWIGESMEDVVRTPMTDAELEKALEQP